MSRELLIGEGEGVSLALESCISVICRRDTFRNNGVFIRPRFCACGCWVGRTRALTGTLSICGREGTLFLKVLVLECLFVWGGAKLLLRTVVDDSIMTIETGNQIRVLLDMERALQ